ncbi:MAG TPA: YjfB family protein [Phycisphaerae bacterium]|nr:putative motility protein [Phycisphaerae bacterium]HOJ56114.1 YjfB family protein [Phycisphaerae bacterium]HOL25801.1 YjfB family protein [Phycisphaerae bacterium]HPP19506.1 YjfB family protein [Phycisphaerae bacterium]
MSMIDGIASMSTALSQLQLQTEVSTRVLKMAQGQGQVSAQLLNAAMENVQEVISEMAEGLGDGVDIYG